MANTKTNWQAAIKGYAYLKDYKDSEQLLIMCQDRLSALESAEKQKRMEAENAAREAAERWRQETAATAALRAKKRGEYSKQLTVAEQRKQVAETELANLKGLFSGKRRKELEAQISEDATTIERLQNELKALQ